MRLPSRLPMPLRVLLALLAVHAADRAVAWACSCAPVDDPVAAMDDYDEVFVGRAEGTGFGCGQADVTTRFEVVEAFKGVDVGDTVQVEHGTQSASCGLTYDRGATYLVFAAGGFSNLCSPGGPAMLEADTVQALRDATGG
ncbi:MAG: hypothetical protein H6742_17695 [Alphaproteobacteria bacterium]|nr:hypothetical protein [Alphaproteobacteria bacterium]